MSTHKYVFLKTTDSDNVIEVAATNDEDCYKVLKEQIDHDLVQQYSKGASDDSNEN